MKPWDKTTMGGAGSQFKTTQWSHILSAKTENETRRHMILNNLAETYWKPVYCYLRSKGFDNDAAKDLTQDFFSEIVLGRNLIQNANQLKGRFRTFLLVALDRYVVSTYRRAGRIKRGGQVNIAKLDFADLTNIEVLESMQSPDQAFYYGWIANLIEEVLTEVKDEYCSTMRASHWDALRLRLLEPVLNDSQPPGWQRSVVYVR
jgi:DNA-directed RNA polymerase specialized sigma24 family protein